MSYNVAAIIGSGTALHTRGILSPTQRGIQSDGQGLRTGTQVMVANPEDLVSVDAFAVSGISVSTTPIKIFSKDMAALIPWPRTRLIRIENATDSTSLTVANSAAKTAEGWVLTNAGSNTPRASVDLPVMDSVEIWAVGSAALNVRMLLF